MCGAMKSRGLCHRRREPLEVKVEEREGWTPLDRPPSGRKRDSVEDTVVPSNVRWSPVTLMRSSHRLLISAACGNENPTNLSVDGVFNPYPRAPAHAAPGPTNKKKKRKTQPDDMLNDDDYPAYTMGRAAEIVGASPDFQRRLDEAKLIIPFRAAGGHRRYSRYQLRLAARSR